jgi:hypothetical protein
MGRGPVAVATALIAIAIAAAPAAAASTRPEYVGQVEPICRAAAKSGAKAYYALVRANRKLYLQLHSGIPRVKAYNQYFRRAARSLARNSRIYSGVTSQIESVSPAPGDETSVASWLAKRTESADLLSRAAMAARHHRFQNQQTLETRSALADIDGENFVADFGFRYCTPTLSDL